MRGEAGDRFTVSGMWHYSLSCDLLLTLKQVGHVTARQGILRRMQISHGLSIGLTGADHRSFCHVYISVLGVRWKSSARLKGLINLYMPCECH